MRTNSFEHHVLGRTFIIVVPIFLCVVQEFEGKFSKTLWEENVITAPTPIGIFLFGSFSLFTEMLVPVNYVVRRRQALESRASTNVDYI